MKAIRFENLSLYLSEIKQKQPCEMFIFVYEWLKKKYIYFVICTVDKHFQRRPIPLSSIGFTWP